MNNALGLTATTYGLKSLGFVDLTVGYLNSIPTFAGVVGIISDSLMSDRAIPGIKAKKCGRIKVLQVKRGWSRWGRGQKRLDSATPGRRERCLRRPRASHLARYCVMWCLCC